MQAEERHTSENLVQPLPMVSTPKKHRVRCGSLAHKRHFSEVRSGATVGAPSHAHNDRVISKSVFFTDLFNFVNEKREVLTQPPKR